MDWMRGMEGGWDECIEFAVLHHEPSLGKSRKV